MTKQQQQRPGASAHAALIDEYGELSRRIAAFKPVAERHKKLKEEIESWYAPASADEAFVEDGEAYSVQIGARSHERKIVSMDRVYKRLGKSTFLQWCTFPLAAIDKLLGNTPGLVDCERTGYRKIAAVARSAAKAA